MEGNGKLALKFVCNEIIDINPKEYWNEIIQLTFVNKEQEYLAITRLPYEDQIYIEYNDQINFLYLNYKNIKFRQEKSILTIEVFNPIKGNLPNIFTVEMLQTLSNLNEILDALLLEAK
jgi:hypothetical protein